MRSRRKKKPQIEIYEIGRSPLAQRLTQQKFAKLIRVPLSELKGLIKYRDSFVNFGAADSGGKPRPLCYPVGRLRVINEKIRYQLNKIRLPDYVKSPRKGIGQKQNAEAHLLGKQVLKLDLCKFYPSISRTMVAKYFREEFGMHADVAGLITNLLTHNERIFYGAPCTSVLAFLVNKKMFDEVDAICRSYNCRMTLWVDNLTISGEAVPGALLEEVRDTIAKHGHKSHEISFEHTNRNVSITGVNVRDAKLHPANSSDLAIRDLERQLHETDCSDEYEQISNQLLSRLGSQRHIVDQSSLRGRKLAQRMNAVRQKRDRVRRVPYNSTT